MNLSVMGTANIEEKTVGNSNKKPINNIDNKNSKK